MGNLDIPFYLCIGFARLGFLRSDFCLFVWGWILFVPRAVLYIARCATAPLGSTTRCQQYSHGWEYLTYLQTIPNFPLGLEMNNGVGMGIDLNLGAIVGGCKVMM